MGKKLGDSQYDSSNQKALQKLSEAIPRIVKNLPEDYKSWQNMRFPYDINAKYNVPKPLEYSTYVKISKENLSADTKQLTVAVEKEWKKNYTQQVKYTTPKWKTVKSYKIPKGKFKTVTKPLTYD